jgi:hypothetical protein
MDGEFNRVSRPRLLAVYYLLLRMGAQLLVFVRGITLLSVLLSAAALNDPGYTVERYDESLGIYYENKGMAVMYNVEWRTIVYVDLSKFDNETLAIRQYIHHVDMLCQMSIIHNWTGCAHFSDNARSRLSWLTQTEVSLKEITGQRIGGMREKEEY